MPPASGVPDVSLAGDIGGGEEMRCCCCCWCVDPGLTDALPAELTVASLMPRRWPLSVSLMADTPEVMRRLRDADTPPPPAAVALETEREGPMSGGMTEPGWNVGGRVSLKRVC